MFIRGLCEESMRICEGRGGGVTCWSKLPAATSGHFFDII
jgi:hypothetical protein